MGFTRYWTRTTKPITEEFCNSVREILKDCAKKGIAIRDWDGQDAPTITVNRIAFNGNANSDKKLYCESFVLNNDELNEFSFCKTRRMPYDYAVREVLKLAEKEGLVFNVSCDYPSNDKIYSDEEYILGYVDLKD